MTPDIFMIETYSGLAFDLRDPSPKMVCLTDVAHALSNTCRYNGHCSKFYSVAEHSVHVANFIHALDFGPDVAFAALMHDGCEAYTGDFPSPFKWAVPELKAIENLVQCAVNAYFGIDPEHSKHEVIEETDKRIVVDERKKLMSPPTIPWAVDHLIPLNIKIECWTPEQAELKFLTLFRALDAARNGSS